MQPMHPGLRKGCSKPIAVMAISFYWSDVHKSAFAYYQRIPGPICQYAKGQKRGCGLGSPLRGCGDWSRKIDYCLAMETRTSRSAQFIVNADTRRSMYEYARLPLNIVLETCHTKSKLSPSPTLLLSHKDSLLSFHKARTSNSA